MKNITRRIYYIIQLFTIFIFRFISDTTPTILSVFFLFVIPDENIFNGKPYRPIVEWNQIEKMFPWQTILLIGPVIAMAEALEVISNKNYNFNTS